VQGSRPAVRGDVSASDSLGKTRSDLARHGLEDLAFNQLQSQQPQTLAHALTDSPVGLLGWNTQLMTLDAMGDKQLDEDFILTNVALYWLTNTGGSLLRGRARGTASRAHHGPARRCRIPRRLLRRPPVRRT
jgi:hypothetical protein